MVHQIYNCLSSWNKEVLWKSSISFEGFNRAISLWRSCDWLGYDGDGALEATDKLRVRSYPSSTNLFIGELIDGTIVDVNVQEEIKRVFVV